MASSDFVTEVEVQPEIQEVEIEAIPVDVPVETIETYDGQPIIALQQLPEPGREEIIFQTQEEVVGEQEIPYEIPVPVEHDVCVESSPGPSKKNQRKGQKRRRDMDEFTSVSVGHKWEQKQVQIKTLEGEFSVTMWSSGVDEGKRRKERVWRSKFLIFLCVCLSSCLRLLSEDLLVLKRDSVHRFVPFVSRPLTDR